MSYSRAGVLVTQDIVLRVVFEDDTGALVDPEAGDYLVSPTIYIYDETFDHDAIEAEYDAQVFTGLGPFTASRISTGYYEYVFTVPSGSDPGLWHDLWMSTRDSVPSHEIFTFVVVEETHLTLQNLAKNQLVVVTLDSKIADVDGNTLLEDVVITYSTIYDPLYASSDLIRMEVGPWIDFIPNDTLNLFIHWASKEADAVTPKGWGNAFTVTNGDCIWNLQTSKGKNLALYKLARTKFIIYDVAMRALMLPGAANSANVSGAGQLKRLGDLTIQGPANAGFGASGLSWNQITELKRLRDEWWRVMNAGGNIVPGQSLDPSFAVKGLGDPDRRRIGRLWESTEDVYYRQPTVNTKRRRIGHRNYRFVYRDTN